MELLLLLALGALGGVTVLWLRARRADGKADSETRGSAAAPDQRRLRDGPHPRFTGTMQVGCAADDCWFDIVGESSYQGTLRLVAGRRLQNDQPVHVECLIAPEPDCPQDANALAVYIDGHGKVGYFSREDVVGNYGALRDRLDAANSVGRCSGKLTGGWEDDIHIGVRLALIRPRDMRGEARTEQPPAAEPPETLDAPDGWALRRRIEIPPGKGWVNLVDEYMCQSELHRLAEDRDVSRETIGFMAVLVPADGAVIVCADGGSPVGRLGRGDVTRFAELVQLLVAENAIAICGGWVVGEADRLGAKVTLPGPKAVMKTLGIDSKQM